MCLLFGCCFSALSLLVLDVCCCGFLLFFALFLFFCCSGCSVFGSFCYACFFNVVSSWLFFSLLGCLLSFDLFLFLFVRFCFIRFVPGTWCFCLLFLWFLFLILFSQRFYSLFLFAICVVWARAGPIVHWASGTERVDFAFARSLIVS